MKEKLKKLLAEKQPALKDYQVENCVNKYVDAVMQQIATQFATITSRDLEEGEFSFAEEVVYEKCGQVSINGKRTRIYTLMQADRETSLVIVTYKGNSISRRVSKVTFNPRYRKEIFKQLTTTDYELEATYLDDLDAKTNYSIVIDMDALDSYIRHTKAALSKSPNIKYTEKLYRNLSAANHVKQRAERQDDGSYALKEYWEQIDSGRIHGHGLSLQRVSKEVRHAALGRCVKIDFKASSYAILASLALAIDPSLKVQAIKDYIKHRTAIRQRLAKKIGISEEWMKTIFTAMGFGADVKDNPFSSIRKMLGQEKFNRLVADDEFGRIKDALDDVRKAVLKAKPFAEDDFEIGGYKYNATDPKTSKRRTRNQKLAWIYQACERSALDLVIDKMPQGYEMLLPVHDCLYIRQSLPAEVAKDLKVAIRGLFELLDFEQEDVIPIHAAEDHYKYSGPDAEDEAAHRSRMLDAERQATGYQPIHAETSSSATKTFIPETEEDYEAKRKRHFLLDVQMHQRNARSLDVDE